MTTLFRTTLVEAPFSSVINYVTEFFDERPHLRVKAFASTNVNVETQRQLVDDKTDSVRGHDALTISWQPRWSVFPSFRGLVTVRPQSPGSILALEGAYEPPGGPAGQIFDRFVGRRLAYGTMDHLLDRLRRYIKKRHVAFQQACPTNEQLNDLERSHRSGTQS